MFAEISREGPLGIGITEGGGNVSRAEIAVIPFMETIESLKGIWSPPGQIWIFYHLQVKRSCMCCNSVVTEDKTNTVDGLLDGFCGRRYELPSERSITCLIHLGCGHLNQKGARRLEINQSSSWNLFSLTGPRLHNQSIAATLERKKKKREIISNKRNKSVAADHDNNEIWR
jgi:hypothetical protein